MPHRATRCDGGSTVGRRRLLAGVATGLAALVAGCGGDPSTLTSSPSAATDADEFTDRAIEVLHGWTGGDGAKAIGSVERLFRERHSGVSIDFSPIGGTGNENLNSAIDRRLANGNPPSTFAAWPGRNLAQYDGQLLDITDVWEANDFVDSVHPRVGEYCRRNGGYRAVPIGSHRLNNLFYNVDVLASAGVDPDDLTSVEALVSALEAVGEQTDAVPLAHAMQAPWTNLQLLVEVLLSRAGRGAYQRFLAGEAERTVVVRALEATRTLLSEYINDDASTISFTEANRKLIRGEAAIIYQGSWVYGMYRNADSLDYGTDWDWVAFPGTEGMYVANLDAFAFPTENRTPERKDVWAEFVGKPDPQIAFSNRKGSVPVRTDFESDRLADFLELTWTHLTESSTLVPTLAHGLAVEPETLARCKSVVGDHFMGPFDVERTADGLLEVLGN